MIRLSNSVDTQKSIGIETSIDFNETYLENKSHVGEVIYFYSNFESISETQDIILMSLKTAKFIFFPKRQIKDLSALRNFLGALCVQQNKDYLDEKDWVWK